MESKHISRNVNVSVRKVRMIIPEIKKLTPVMSLIKLAYLPHSAAKYMRHAIKTALSNATSTLKVSEDMLEFRRIQADQGVTLKRFRAGSRGSPLPVVRRMTHITVVLGEKKSNTPLVSSKSKVKPEIKKEEKVEVKKAKPASKKKAVTTQSEEKS
ncbi:MAG: uL22 family ribosomal protein [Candidatus Roizmanbacteria bacterium]